jgi:eukaryotic-like serine/threonine-protein kinase
MNRQVEPEVPSGSVGVVVDARYLLVREIGRGSTGIVWEARDLTSDEPVAVKILHATLLASSSARRRFYREVATAQMLDHPHCVCVKARGQAPDGTEYLVMELLQGRTLAAVLADHAPLPQVRAIRITAQILEAMQVAHRLNIVHRDLKPSNIILTTREGHDDFVKICDFGLAKIVDFQALEQDEQDEQDNDDEDPHSSLSNGLGELCGTPEYMAPEQARGESLDGRADLYSTAVILFQAVVGQVPFQGRTPLAVITRHLGEPPPRPRSIRPDLNIAPALENLILRGLAKDPRERTSSAQVFRADLLQVEQDLVRDGRRRAAPADVARQDVTLPSAVPAEPEVRTSPRFFLLRPSRVMIGLAGVGLLVAARLAWKIQTQHQTQHQTPLPANDIVPPNRAADLPGPPNAEHVAPPSALPKQAEVVTGAPAQKAERRTRRSKASALVPQPSEAALSRAEAALEEGRLEDACELGLAVAGSQPHTAAPWEFLGRCYMRLGRPGEARAFYRTYLSRAPADADTAFIRAILAQGAPARSP